MHHTIIILLLLAAAVTTTAAAATSNNNNTVGDGCSYGGFDFVQLSEFGSIVLPATAPTPSYTYVTALCGVVNSSYPKCASSSGTMCQYSESGGVFASVVARSDPSSPPVWSFVNGHDASDGVQAVYTNGDACAITGPRTLTTTFVCDAEHILGKMVVSENGGPASCSYHLTVATSLACGGPLSPPKVVTDTSVIYGLRHSSPDIEAFYALPYAVAPIGGLRFQVPLPPLPLPPMFNATRVDAPSCYQVSPFPVTRNQSEDCLTLRVYRPVGTTSNSGWDVLFWIYGGSLMFGDNGDSYPGLANLVGDNTIVVALNYRVNIFGFLTHPALSQCHDLRKVSGNLGIEDQLAALEWVQRNIGYFGGNPKRVTVMGQSSGGTSIMALMGAPRARGLFSGAISLSGSLNNSMTLAEAERQNAMVLNKSCPVTAADTTCHQQVACALSLPADELVKMTPASWNFAPLNPLTDGNVYPGLSVVDGFTVQYAFEDALRVPVVDVPLVLQSVEQEIETFTFAQIGGMTVGELDTWMQKSFSGHGDTGAYMEAFMANYTAVTPSKTYYTVNSDLGVTCGQVAVGAAAKRSKAYVSPIYVTVVATAPAMPFPAFGGPSSFLHYNFHLWDYIAVTNAWDFFVHIGATAAYKPQPRDLALGVTLNQVFDAIVHGTSMPSSVLAVDKCYSGACLNVVTPDPVNGDRVVVTRSAFKEASCAFYERIDVVSEAFWWCD